MAMQALPESRRRRTVLLAHRDPSVREASAWCLIASGWRVSLASNGEEAERIAASHLPDAVVVDTDLPGVNGIELACRLRRDRLASVAIVGCGRGESRMHLSEVLATTAGCDAFLALPFAVEELRGLLDRLVPEKARSF